MTGVTLAMIGTGGLGLSGNLGSRRERREGVPAPAWAPASWCESFPGTNSAAFGLGTLILEKMEAFAASRSDSSAAGG